MQARRRSAPSTATSSPALNSKPSSVHWPVEVSTSRTQLAAHDAGGSVKSIDASDALKSSMKLSSVTGSPRWSTAPMASPLR